MCVCVRETEIERERERESSQGPIKHIKHTYLFLLTWKKVKAHDSYKHICYQVVHILNFDALN